MDTSIFGQLYFQTNSQMISCIVVQLIWIVVHHILRKYLESKHSWINLRLLHFPCNIGIKFCLFPTHPGSFQASSSDWFRVLYFLVLVILRSFHRYGPCIFVYFSSMLLFMRKMLSYFLTSVFLFYLFYYSHS